MRASGFLTGRSQGGSSFGLAPSAAFSSGRHGASGKRLAPGPTERGGGLRFAHPRYVLSDGHSPDRLDALVWAVTELTKRGGWQGPRIRSLGDPQALVPWRTGLSR